MVPYLKLFLKLAEVGSRLHRRICRIIGDSWAVCRFELAKFTPKLQPAQRCKYPILGKLEFPNGFSRFSVATKDDDDVRDVEKQRIADNEAEQRLEEEIPEE